MRKLAMVLFSLFFLFSCGGEKEVVYVDPSWEPDQLIMAANQYLQEQDYEHAFEAFNTVYTNYPTSRLYTDAVLGLAYVYGKKEQYEKQMELLYSLVSENLVPSKIPSIYNQIAEFYEKTSTIMREINPDDTLDLVRARDYYQKSINYALSTDSLSKAEAKYKMALIEFQLNHQDKGLGILKELVAQYPGNPWAIQAENFILTFEETGLVPGAVMVEDTAAIAQPQTLQPGPVIEEFPTDTSGFSPDTMPPAPTDTVKKSILEEIPDKQPTKIQQLDSLIEKLE
ncbi:MAG: hypothetical protein Kow00108_17410 [Calditrichia bacterium]